MRRNLKTRKTSQSITKTSKQNTKYNAILKAIRNTAKNTTQSQTQVQTQDTIQNKIKGTSKNINKSTITRTTKRNNKRKEYKHLKHKASNNKPIRVLYKKVGLTPIVRVIPSVYKLKKAVIKQKLDLIPFQNVYIICHNKEKRKTMPINILLDFSNISGDFIVVQINRTLREFESMSEENIIWFTECLNRKSFTAKSTTTNYNSNNSEKNILNFRSIKPILAQLEAKTNTNFENKLVNALSNINLTLSYLISNDKKWGVKNFAILNI